MTRTESEIRAELAIVEQHAVIVTNRLRQVEGHADQLRSELADLEGAASDRFVGAR